MTSRSIVATLILCLAFASTAPAAADELCGEYTPSQRISRLGLHPISEAPIETHDDLLREAQHHRDELVAILRERGMEDLIGDLVQALQTGEGLTERQLVPGETFEWMAWRGDYRGPTSTGPMCLVDPKAGGAFEVKITRVSGAEPSAPNCGAFLASGNAEAKTLSANASGVSGDVTVTRSGPGGTETVISPGGSKSWSGAWTTPYKGTNTFAVKAKAKAVERHATTYTFVIPKICLNLAFAGAETKAMDSKTPSCEQSFTVEPAKAPAAKCSIELSPNPVKKKAPAQVTVNGHWDSDNAAGMKVDVTRQGRRNKPDEKIETLSPPFGTVSYDKKGKYLFEGTATNEAGETANCSAVLCVGRGYKKDPECRSGGVIVGGAGAAGSATSASGGGTSTGAKRGFTGDSRWTARFFGAHVEPDDSRIFSTTTLPSGSTETTQLALSSGIGAGAGLEYHATDRVGVEAGLLVAQIDSLFLRDRDDAWGMDDDEIGLVALTVGPNFHLTPDSAVDFFFGPFIGFASLDDASYQTLGQSSSTNLDDEFIWGGKLGLDIPLGDASRWGFHLGLTYMDLSSGDVDIDPLIPVAGFAVKF